MLMPNFGGTNKQHYSMLWYFLEWSICKVQGELKTCLMQHLGGTTESINPLGPKSVQHQFSPNNISRSTRIKVMRITN